MKATIVALALAVGVSQAFSLRDAERSKAAEHPVKAISASLPSTRNSRIISGQTATRGQFPHQAALFVDGIMYCSGSLISSGWILTAAHCVDNLTVWEIYLGAQDLDVLEEGRQTIVSADAIQHEDFSTDFYWNDIAVISLGTTIVSTEYIQPVNLPSSSEEAYEGETAIVSGWGQTSDVAGSDSSTLQYAEMTVISNLACLLDYGDSIISGTLCALGAEGQATCDNDGGDPLVVGSLGSYTQIGIASFHPTVCDSAMPDGFTRVSEYLDWISANTNIVETTTALA